MAEQNQENKEYYKNWLKEQRKQKRKRGLIAFVSVVAGYAIVASIMFFSFSGESRKYGESTSLENFKSQFESDLDSIKILNPAPSSSYQITDNSKARLKIVVKTEKNGSEKKSLTYKHHSSSKETDVYSFSSSVHSSKSKSDSVSRTSSKMYNDIDYNHAKSESRRQLSEIFGKDTAVTTDQIEKTYQTVGEIDKAAFSDALVTNYKNSVYSRLSFTSYKPSDESYSYHYKKNVYTVTTTNDNYLVDSGLGFKIGIKISVVIRFYLDENKPKVETSYTADSSLSLDKYGNKPDKDNKAYYNISYNYSYKRTYKIKKVNKKVKQQKLDNFTLLD